jgi:methionyl aminopeptidase
MTIQNDADLQGLQRIGRIVADVLATMLDRLEPGMTTAELDGLGRRLLEQRGARSAPELTYKFPGATCISINEQAAHGIPGTRRIEAGDVVNVDVSAELDGYFADTGGTRVVPPSSPLKDRLCDATRRALAAAMQEARAGARINRIGAAIERVADAHGLRTIRNLGSHGVGRALHEYPGSIAGYYEASDRRRLTEGLVITIEPFLSTRSTQVRTARDGWTLLGEKGNLSAQYEHTMVITRGEPIVVTRTH